MVSQLFHFLRIIKITFTFVTFEFPKEEGKYEQSNGNRRKNCIANCP